MKSWKNLISEAQFWEIINASLLEAQHSYANQMASLEKILNKKTKKEIIGFCYHNCELCRKAYTSRLWAAAYIVMCGCGDSSFFYFRCWLISRGKSVYNNALKNADSLVTEIGNYKYCEEIKADSMNLIADTVFKEKFKTDLYLFDIIEEEYAMNYDNKSEEEQSIEFDWEEDDEESLKLICPNLFKKYYKKPLIHKSWT